MGEVAGDRKVPFRIFVAGTPCDIVVYSRSKTVSIAVGEYSGKQIEVRGASPIGAGEAWAKAAERSTATE
jgi:hypothetical protein